MIATSGPGPDHASPSPARRWDDPSTAVASALLGSRGMRQDSAHARTGAAARDRCGLGRAHRSSPQATHLRKPPDGDPSLLGQGHRLTLPLSGLEVVAHVVVGAAAAGHPSNAAEAVRRYRRTASAALLRAVVQVPAAAAPDSLPQRLAEGGVDQGAGAVDGPMPMAGPP